VLAKDANLSIPRYVKPIDTEVRTNGEGDITKAWAVFDANGREFWQQMDTLVEMLDSVVAEEAADA
jgi:type I restriction enzyme M protein